MSAARLLAEAHAAGIVLSAAGGRLRYSAPVGRLTPELREALAANRAAILESLEVEAVRCERDPATGWTVAWVPSADPLEANPTLLEGDAPIFYDDERPRLDALSPARRLAEYWRRLAGQRRSRRVRP